MVYFPQVNFIVCEFYVSKAIIVKKEREREHGLGDGTEKKTNPRNYSQYGRTSKISGQSQLT